MSDFRCPLMDEAPQSPDYPAVWRPDNTCSYCGSMNPDDFMARLEVGTIELQTTSKNYKVYTTAIPGTPPVPIKFYFQHLSVDQRHRFLAIFMEGRIKFRDSVGFQVLPFFIAGRRAS